MGSHKCKLCFRNFANGKALGGHMRAHMMATKKKEEDRVPEFQSSSSQEDDDPKESQISVDQESSQDEAESSRRSKRARKYSDKFPMNNEISHSPLSSISEIITPDEDVAYCLMMMSRDKWGRENDDFGAEKVDKSKVKGKYRCETCCRSFRSYQALGGHRASHNKIKVNAAPPEEEDKIHECPFCNRVFASGQALGGHKRSHYIAAPTIQPNLDTIKQISRNCENLDIDLNLPAPIDDDDITH
ncbi:hypothetical protein ACS0TY_003617 [Phlomoides rotata]